MRVISILAAILGVVVLVMGIMFINQAGVAEEKVAKEIEPLKVSDVDSRYDAVKARQAQLAQAEGAALQAGNPSMTYTYLTLQRTSLGLTRSNLGMADFIRMAGIINIVLGAGVILLAIGMFFRRK
ncbi:MAG TPA: hypothetical protein VLH15_10040 [Dehalococcoidales bacterium]|nr:hypothetical protein [Dehalococcoidales bacterium]